MASRHHQAEKLNVMKAIDSWLILFILLSGHQEEAA
jgi:hypothetical protein